MTSSLYDVVSSCLTRCYLCHVIVEMSHLRQVQIAPSSGDDDREDNWLIVTDVPQHSTLIPGDR